MNKTVRHFTFFVFVCAFTLLGIGAFAASSFTTPTKTCKVWRGKLV
jgi:hypothetical protein